MITFARTSFEIPPSQRQNIVCGLTLPFGPGVTHAEAVEALACRICDNTTEDECSDSWAKELALSALWNYHFPYDGKSEVTIFLYLRD